jgi:glycosyltransferase involved in cell wall biosynthesis
MKISAVITAYNYAGFLPAALDSVLEQTRPADEIVVVDDGSTDDTALVVARYAGRGVRYVYKANGGAGAARNRGIRETSGDLVAFLDGDDRWVADKLSLQLAHLERNPDVGLVTGSEWQVYSSGVRPYLLRRPAVASADFYPGILVENTVGNPSLTLIRRECFDKAGLFDENMPLGQDWDMWIRLAMACRVGVVDAPLILFNRHGGSLTANKVLERYRSNLRIQRRYIRRVPDPLRRLRLFLSAYSMNFYYTAAALADSTQPPAVSSHRWRAFSMAFASALLNPTYETRNKAGLLARTALGRPAFDRLRRISTSRR